MTHAMRMASVKAALQCIKATTRRPVSADAMDDTLTRLEAGIRQSRAAVNRSRNTAAQEAARTQRFQQARPGFGDRRLKAPDPIANFMQQWRNTPYDHDDPFRVYDRQPTTDNERYELGNKLDFLRRYLETSLPSNWDAHPERTFNLGVSGRLPGYRPQGFEGYLRANPAFRAAQLRAMDINRYPTGERRFQERQQAAPQPSPFKSIMRGVLAAIKQRGQVSPTIAPIQATLRQRLAGSPGYVTQPEIPAVRAPGRSMLPGLRAGSGIEPTPARSDTLVGMTAPTALNWARTENRQQLRNMLGRKPTPEERRAGMQVRRQLAREAGQPFVAIDPDNPSPRWWDGRGQADFPYTFDNRQLTRKTRDWLRDEFPDLDPEALRDEVRQQRTYARADIRYGEGHPIHPNARIRTFPYSGTPRPEWMDPRLPERYNRLLPPDKQMTQDQMDTIRRGYYTRYPDLVPVPGQPGYDAWRKQNLRGK